MYPTIGDLGPSTLVHRECGAVLERVNLYFSPNPTPGLRCWRCQTWITLAALTRNLIERGRWGK
jgi:hypothetical protein